MLRLPIELFHAVYRSYPWQFGTATCRLRAFVTELSPLVSVMILTVFSVERYLCICNPFQRRPWGPCFRMRWPSESFSTCNCGHISHVRQLTANCQVTQSIHRSYCGPNLPSRTLKSCTVLIVIIWLVAAMSAIPVVGLSEAFPYVHLPSWQVYTRQFNDTICPQIVVNDSGLCLLTTPDACLVQIDSFWIEGRAAEESYVCAPSEHSIWAQYMSIQVVFLMSTALFFVTPMFVITIMYSRIAIQIRRSNFVQILAQSTTNASEPVKFTTQGQTAARNRKGITRMLVAVIVAFFICWAPFHLQRVVTVTNIQLSYFTAEFIFYLSGFLYYISPTVNPILYSLMSVRFRRAFVAVFCTKKHTRQPRRQPTLKNTCINVSYAPRCEHSQASSSQRHERFISIQ
ncbi:neuropeptides capa receptor [Clonorchis sinensis]|uniref:Neuropeptides capa receptor n=1 Tax=Clonorchis sinensis TaxID=79923 RepID=G7Y8A0_CLOSI|nr:neuropeptides capa receptor [Clonorchis sinensis]